MNSVGDNGRISGLGNVRLLHSMVVESRDHSVASAETSCPVKKAAATILKIYLVLQMRIMIMSLLVEVLLKGVVVVILKMMMMIVAQDRGWFSCSRRYMAPSPKGTGKYRRTDGDWCLGRNCRRKTPNVKAMWNKCQLRLWPNSDRPDVRRIGSYLDVLLIVFLVSNLAVCWVVFIVLLAYSFH